MVIGLVKYVWEKTWSAVFAVLLLLLLFCAFMLDGREGVKFFVNKFKDYP